MWKSCFFISNIKNVAENKQLWKIVKNCFLDKSDNFKNTTSVENEKVILDEKKAAEVFSEYFDALISDLN